MEVRVTFQTPDRELKWLTCQFVEVPAVGDMVVLDEWWGTVTARYWVPEADHHRVTVSLTGVSARPRPEDRPDLSPDHPVFARLIELAHERMAGGGLDG